MKGGRPLRQEGARAVNWRRTNRVGRYGVGVALPAAETDERELLLSWLQFLRDAVPRKADGLTEDQARRRPDGRLTSIAGIVNDLARVEWRWIDGTLRGERVSRSEEEFTVPIRRPLPTSWPATGPVLSEPTRACALPIWTIPAPTHAIPESPCVGCCCLAEETARHAGHADSTRELLDGTVGV